MNKKSLRLVHEPFGLSHLNIFYECIHLGPKNESTRLSGCMSYTKGPV